jgi:hypothetical protein
MNIIINFINFNEEYLFYIKAFYKSQNRTIWNIKIKYNKEANDKIIYDYLYRCLNKKTNEIYNPI